MRDYLTIADVLGMHRILIERHGGASGIRDMGALEAAVYRPQSGYYEDIVWEAAALMESLTINHPFVDGNKRIAFACVDVFLRINGHRINQPAMEIYGVMMRLFDEQKFEVAELEPWLRSVIEEA